jgi:hypothetical protein
MILAVVFGVDSKLTTNGWGVSLEQIQLVVRK